jgi:hypothetical protein
VTRYLREIAAIGKWIDPLLADSVFRDDHLYRIRHESDFGFLAHLYPFSIEEERDVFL